MESQISLAGPAPVCVCVCACVLVCFLTRQRQYCIFHSSCRLIGCDICLRRTLPSFLPSPHLSTPYLLLSPFICSPLLIPSLFLFFTQRKKKKKRFPFKIKCVFVCSAIVEMGDRHRANNNQSEHNNAPLMWC